MKYILFALAMIPSLLMGQTDKFSVDALLTPKRTERIISVGGVSSDIQGFTNEAIQVAVDALPGEGGTIKLGKGNFTIKAPVRLKSNVRLIGSGPETILRRIDGFRSKFIIDADYGELKLTVEDPSGFETGMSVQVTDRKNSECWDVTTAVITGKEGNLLYIDSYLVRDYDCEQDGMVTNAGSCISVVNARNILISNLLIDGNKLKNDLLDGCNGGGIAIFKSKDVTVENVTVKDFNGEGITWQITENISVKNSEITGCTNMGLHPGTGSPNSLIEGNNSHNNKVGLFICWRVYHSIVKDNQFHNNSDCGISTGHKDTDVVFENNHIYENGTDGVYLRDEDSKNSPHRNSFIKNTVENNGTIKGGYGFSLNGNASDLILQDNIIRENKNGTQKAGIFISKNFPPFKEINNKMSGHKLGNIINE